MKLRAELKTIRRHLKSRDWHQLRCHLNGYLAEPSYTNLRFYRAGHGWTKRRAAADLGRHLANPEAYLHSRRKQRINARLRAAA